MRTDAEKLRLIAEGIRGFWDELLAITPKGEDEVVISELVRSEFARANRQLHDYADYLEYKAKKANA